MIRLQNMFIWSVSYPVCIEKVVGSYGTARLELKVTLFNFCFAIIFVIVNTGLCNKLMRFSGRPCLAST